MVISEFSELSSDELNDGISRLLKSNPPKVKDIFTEAVIEINRLNKEIINLNNTINIKSIELNELKDLYDRLFIKYKDTKSILESQENLDYSISETINVSKKWSKAFKSRCKELLRQSKNI